MSVYCSSVDFLWLVVFYDLQNIRFKHVSAEHRSVGIEGEATDVGGILDVRIFGRGVGEIFCEVFQRVALGEAWTF